MFGWFRPDDFLNGMAAEVVAMIIEVVVIVNIVQWLRKRDDNRRLKPYRTRIRKLLRRGAVEMDDLLIKALEAIKGYRGEIDQANHGDLPLPPPTEAVGLVVSIKQHHEQLARDYALSLPHLDEATSKIYEACLDRMEAMLAVWPIWRMTDPGFRSQWSGWTRDEQNSYARTLTEAEGSLLLAAQIASAINACLLRAESHSDGDTDLIREAKKLKDGTHVLLRPAHKMPEASKS